MGVELASVLAILYQTHEALPEGCNQNAGHIYSLGLDWSLLEQGFEAGNHRRLKRSKGAGNPFKPSVAIADGALKSSYRMTHR